MKKSLGYSFEVKEREVRTGRASSLREVRTWPTAFGDKMDFDKAKNNNLFLVDENSTDKQILFFYIDYTSLVEIKTRGTHLKVCSINPDFQVDNIVTVYFMTTISKNLTIEKYFIIDKEISRSSRDPLMFNDGSSKTLKQMSYGKSTICYYKLMPLI